MEPYSYVGNNPIMFTDPTGMSKEGGIFPFPIGGFVVFLKLVSNVKNALEAYNKRATGGFAFHGSSMSSSGDLKLLRKGSGEWIDGSGFTERAGAF